MANKFMKKDKILEIIESLGIQYKKTDTKERLITLIQEKEYSDYLIINKKNKIEWEKSKKENKPKINISKSEENEKRYKITRKCFYGTAYIEDDIIYVNNYMEDYILNPLFTIESSMFNYYLHSIYDTYEEVYINAINL
jgi:hypothetical protein